MKNSKINLFLLGKKYIDNIIYLQNFISGETNLAIKQENKLGGIHNILSTNIENLNYDFCEYGEKESIIVVEKENSRRSSITRHVDRKNKFFLSNTADWTHVAYIDDIDVFDYSKLNKFSIDFCTTINRNQYYDIMSKSELIFDSRERKYLYEKINLNKPIIFHDHFGCECVINGKKIYESKIKPISGLNVNGAGDVFAAIFIKEYILNGLEEAIKSTSTITTKILQEKNNEKV